MRMSQETVLVSSASSGIGKELARHFAASGSKLVLVARCAKRLAELAHESGGLLIETIASRFKLVGE